MARRINLGDGWREFERSFLASPYAYSRHEQATPGRSLLQRSQGLDLIRQVLPRWAGGYSPQRMAEMRAELRARPDLQEQTLAAGSYAVLGYDDRAAQALPRRERALLNTAQVAGAVSADIATQGLQNVYWFLNAPEAVAMLGAQQALHGAMGKHRALGLDGIDGAIQSGSPFRFSNLRTASAFPLVLGASTAAGNLVRQDGYQAVLPDTEGDRRDTTDPLQERIQRAIGRRGALLPYDEFLKDRPDVSLQQYNAYKAYLHGNKSPVKATLEGIHGPEVNILGRSLPLLTGILPIAAGVLGGRAGVRMAGRRLAGGGGGENQYHRLGELRATASTRKEAAKGSPLDSAEQAAYVRAERNYAAQARKVEGYQLAGAIGGSVSALGVTAAGASLLENMRRARNMEAEKEKSRERRARNEELAGGAT
jgi:hypothetical protein